MSWAKGTAGMAGALLATVAVACGGDEASVARGTPPAATDASIAASGDPRDIGETDLAKRGERIYNVNCIACHHRDPARDGGLGPAISGASHELLEARVLRAEYPQGYSPKRDTRMMVPLRHLEPEIEALTAFLAAR